MKCLDVASITLFYFKFDLFQATVVSREELFQQQQPDATDNSNTLTQKFYIRSWTPIGLIYGLFSRTNSNRQSALQCHVHLDYEISSIFASLLWFASIVQYPNTV